MTATPARAEPAAASLATVAREAGVSVATVSRIVNGKRGRASAQTILRVEDAIARLGYRPNPVGRALKRRASRVIAMLAPNLDNPAMAAIAVSTEAALRRAGYVTILCDTHDRPDLQDEYLEAMRSQFVAGYVMVSAVKSRGLQKAAQRGDPMVFVARRSPFGGGAFVGIDDRGAGADAADYLLARGIDRPAVLMAAQNASSTAERAAGFITRLQERGIPLTAIRQASAEGLNHIEIGYAAATTLVAGQGWPAGIFCVSDLIAYGAYRLAREGDIAVPHRCALVGVDGNALNAWLAPWLTSIRIPYEQYGGHIVSQLRLLWGGETGAHIHVGHGRLSGGTDGDESRGGDIDRDAAAARVD
ncbi:LacI family DNA-binding transcriptional regulator [Bosea sp. (in: a-proteobacteria)]|uniref:LacI family DNA-binding transcriptional regulator n=1 Tax=Bosea sp. (in: a-proteobacteria) TaxID=1871050 RepID=UPI00273268F2|nr:LacI family DNA-binding transcriptional regulator [Bosea sp. (in: a-proteobacteria)]MDP3408809.1 LacI family DNA-binding transcriptional regulator [Bosea sp. (in: a-proteobacteria)]